MDIGQWHTENTKKNKRQELKLRRQYTESRRLQRICPKFQNLRWAILLAHTEHQNKVKLTDLTFRTSDFTVCEFLNSQTHALNLEALLIASDLQCFRLAINIRGTAGRSLSPRTLKEFFWDCPTHIWRFNVGVTPIDHHFLIVVTTISQMTRRLSFNVMLCKERNYKLIKRNNKADRNDSAFLKLLYICRSIHCTLYNCKSNLTII